MTAASYFNSSQTLHPALTKEIRLYHSAHPSASLHVLVQVHHLLHRVLKSFRLYFESSNPFLYHRWCVSKKKFWLYCSLSMAPLCQENKVQVQQFKNMIWTQVTTSASSCPTLPTPTLLFYYTKLHMCSFQTMSSSPTLFPQPKCSFPSSSPGQFLPIFKS